MPSGCPSFSRQWEKARSCRATKRGPLFYTSGSDIRLPKAVLAHASFFPWRITPAVWAGPTLPIPDQSHPIDDALPNTYASPLFWIGGFWRWRSVYCNPGATCSYPESSGVNVRPATRSSIWRANRNPHLGPTARPACGGCRPLCPEGYRSRSIRRACQSCPRSPTGNPESPPDRAAQHSGHEPKIFFGPAQHEPLDTVPAGHRPRIPSAVDERLRTTPLFDPAHRGRFSGPGGPGRVCSCGRGADEMLLQTATPRPPGGFYPTPHNPLLPLLPPSGRLSIRPGGQIRGCGSRRDGHLCLFSKHGAARHAKEFGRGNGFFNGLRLEPAPAHAGPDGGSTIPIVLLLSDLRPVFPPSWSRGRCAGPMAAGAYAKARRCRRPCATAVELTKCPADFGDLARGGAMDPVLTMVEACPREWPQMNRPPPPPLGRLIAYRDGKDKPY